MNDLKQMRELAGLTQRELAKRAGMRSHALISMAEQRGLRLKPAMERKIRAVLLAVLRQHSQKCDRFLNLSSANPSGN
jgi:transcriptional regulator with XRE-family HTH domain